MRAVDSQVHVPLIVNLIYPKPHVRSSKRIPKTHLQTNAWRLFASEFDSLNALFSSTLEACWDRDGAN